MKTQLPVQQTVVSVVTAPAEILRMPQRVRRIVVFVVTTFARKVRQTVAVQMIAQSAATTSATLSAKT